MPVRTPARTPTCTLANPHARPHARPYVRTHTRSPARTPVRAPVHPHARPHAHTCKRTCPCRSKCGVILLSMPIEQSQYIYIYICIYIYTYMIGVSQHGGPRQSHWFPFKTSPSTFPEHKGDLHATTTWRLRINLEQSRLQRTRKSCSISDQVAASMDLSSGVFSSMHLPKWVTKAQGMYKHLRNRPKRSPQRRPGVNEGTATSPLEIKANHCGSSKCPSWALCNPRKSSYCFSPDS